MAETNNTPNLAEVQKIHDALAEKSLEKNDNPLAKLNPDSFSAEYTFKTEYERQMYLVSLNQWAIDAAITWLKTPEGKKVQDAQKMAELLNQRKGDLEKLQRETRAKLHDNALVIDATIPGPKWEKSGKEVMVGDKKYGVEKREWSEKGKSDLKIDAGLTASVLIKDVPDKEIDKVLAAYQSVNMKNSPDSPLKSGMFGKTVKYEEIEKTLTTAPAKVVGSNVEAVKWTDLTLDKNQDILRDGKPFTGKIDKNSPITFSSGNVYSGDIVNGKLEWKGDMVYKSGDKYMGGFKNDKREWVGTYTWGDGDKYEGQWKGGERNWKWKFYSNNPTSWNPAHKYVFDGTYLDGKREWQATITFADGEVWKGEWKDGKFFNGTKTPKDGKSIQYKDGKEVIAERSIADILKEVKAPKWYDISYDGEKKQVQLKKGNKVVGYFTPDRPENQDKKTSDGIQKWVDTKVQKIRDAAADAKDPDKHADAPKVLESIHKISGLEWATTLSELEFKRKGSQLTAPDGLSWEDNEDSGNWNVKLKDGYIVYNGKVVKIWGR